MTAFQSQLARAVTLARDEQTVTLPFRPPFQLLLDEEHCRAWSAELAAHGTAWEIRQATKDLADSLPSAGGLYMFVWRPRFTFSLASGRSEGFGWILYIGQTGADESRATFKSRYKGEYARHIGTEPRDLFKRDEPSGRAGRLGRYLALRPLEFWYTEIDDRSLIAQLERQLIRSFSPPLNDAHALLRKTSTEPAF